MKRGLPATFYLKQNATSLQSRRHIGSPGREPGVENEKEFESPEGAKENSAHVGEYVLSPAFAGWSIVGSWSPGLRPGLPICRPLARAQLPFWPKESYAWSFQKKEFN